jgi:hypothetical protein
MKQDNTRQKTLSTFGITALLKLVALEADANHNGAFTIFSTGDGFKAIYGSASPSQAEAVEAHDSLKSALVNLLVEAPTFAVEAEIAIPAGA